MNDTKARRDKMRIFGVEIESKVNIASLIAFVFSVVALVPQAIGWLRGPTVTLLLPPQVFIAAEKTNTGKDQFVRIGARMSYINDGDKGYNAIILYEVVSFEMGGKKYSQLAHNYGRFELAGDLTLKVADETDAVPVMVEGGALASHESYFAPYTDCDDRLYEECPTLKKVLFWDEFLHQIERTSDQQPRDIQFTFVTRTHDRAHDPAPVTCKTSIDGFALKRIKQFSFAALTCRLS